jgi:hypothetical protein
LKKFDFVLLELSKIKEREKTAGHWFRQRILASIRRIINVNFIQSFPEEES